MGQLRSLVPRGHGLPGQASSMVGPTASLRSCFAQTKAVRGGVSFSSLQIDSAEVRSSANGELLQVGRSVFSVKVLLITIASWPLARRLGV